MKCIDCPYYWNDADYEKGDDFPRCHYTDNWYDDGYAPCEQE